MRLMFDKYVKLYEIWHKGNLGMPNYVDIDIDLNWSGSKLKTRNNVL